MANKYVFTNDVCQVIRDAFINETRVIWQNEQIEPRDYSGAEAMRIVGHMLNLVDQACMELSKDDTEEQ